jgi:hypothetical protein
VRPRRRHAEGTSLSARQRGAANGRTSPKTHGRETTAQGGLGLPKGCPKRAQTQQLERRSTRAARGPEEMSAAGGAAAGAALRCAAPRMVTPPGAAPTAQPGSTLALALPPRSLETCTCRGWHPSLRTPGSSGWRTWTR